MFGRRPKRYGRRRNLGVYSRTFRNILTKPIQVTSEFFGSHNSYQNNLQGQCSWAIVQPGWSPAQVDVHLAAHQNLAINAIKPDIDILLAKSDFMMQVKNMSSIRGDFTMYKLYPKRDIDASLPSIQYKQTAATMVGAGALAINNDIVVAPGVAGLRLPDWNEHMYDITQNSLISNLFHIKKVMRKFMEPGQFVILRNKDTKERVTSKGKFGIAVAGSCAGFYQHFKEHGPLWLLRFQGSNTHDKTLAVPAAQDTDMGSMMGSYNFEVYRRRKQTSYGQIGTAADKNIAMLTARLPTSTLANEVGWEIQPQAQAAGQAQPMVI